MSKTILFIHGAWLTPAVWKPWQQRFEALGYRTLAPAWPLLDRSVQELRETPDAQLGKLTLGRIVDHYVQIIASLPEQPILVGHSYGGLIVQMLLDRGLGVAGVSIAPGPAAGIHPGPKALLSALPVFLAWAGWKRALRMSFGQFAKNFGNRLRDGQQEHAFEEHIVPAPGRIYYQSVFGLGSSIHWRNEERAPLLLLAGTEDRTVEPSMVRQNLRKYAASTALVEMQTLPGKGHFLIAETGWEKVADSTLQWANANQRPTTSFTRPKSIASLRGV